MLGIDSIQVHPYYVTLLLGHLLPVLVLSGGLWQAVQISKDVSELLHGRRRRGRRCQTA